MCSFAFKFTQLSVFVFPNLLSQQPLVITNQTFVLLSSLLRLLSATQYNTTVLHRRSEQGRQFED